MLIHFLEVVVKVAVIGAGISGIGASYSLTQNGIEHIIIEGRDRIGGRIAPYIFDGAHLELGAAFIHQAGISNRIAQFVLQQGWTFVQIGTGPSQFVYQGSGIVSSDNVDGGYGLYSTLCEDVVAKQANSSKSLNLKQLQGNYFKDLTGQAPQAIGVGKWFYDLLGNYNGAKMTDLGSTQCQAGTLEEGDYLPDIGFSAIINYINSTLRPKQLYLNSTVTKIDYSGDKVRIYTDDKVYIADKVISSLPLGVLQEKKVQFVPKLAKVQTQAIDQLGNGIYNKVYVSFQQAFWDTSSEWVDFITKDNKQNLYPASRSIIRQGRKILCFFVSANNSERISKFSQKKLQEDMLSFLKKFYPDKDIKIRQIFVTSWHEDEHSLGSYSYRKVGTDTADVIPKVCATLDDKVWFVGEHCHPHLYSFTHGAFETGVWAAEEVKTKL